MKKNMHDDEALLRDKLLGHKFPEEEPSWEDMEMLLDGAPAPTPPTVPPTQSAPFGGRSSILVWLAGMGLIALMAWASISHIPTIPVPVEEIVPEYQEKSRSIPQSTTSEVTVHADKEPATGRKINERHLLPGQSATQANTSHVSAFQSSSPTSKGGNIGLQKRSGATPSISQSPAVHIAELPSQPSPLTSAGSEIIERVSPAENAVTGTSDRAIDSQADTAAQSSSFSPPSEATQTHSKLAVLSSLPPVNYQTFQLAQAIRLKRVPVPTFKKRTTQIGLAIGGQAATVLKQGYSANSNAIGLSSVTAESATGKRTRMIDLLPAFGLSMTHQLNARWSLEVDLMFKKVTGYDLRAVFADAGFDVSGLYGAWRLERSSNALNFWEMPILFKYQLAPNKQNIFVGIRPALVKPTEDLQYKYTNLGTGSNFAKAADTFNPSIRDGIRHHDIALTLGCEVRLWRNLWVDVRYNQGLLDLTSNSFFKNTNKDLTMDTQFTLRYYFWAL